MLTILIIILVLMAFGALPQFGYNTAYGYGPSGVVGVLVLILLIFLLTGRL